MKYMIKKMIIYISRVSIWFLSVNCGNLIIINVNLCIDIISSGDYDKLRYIILFIIIFFYLLFYRLK